MIARLAMLLVALSACATTTPPIARVSLNDALARPRDCPEAPIVELYTDPPEGPDDSLHVGGHITSIEVARSDDAPRALVGTLDVKGEIAFERVTRALALANYAATMRSAPTRRLTLSFEGRTVAALDVTTALRGRRFRLPVIEDPAAPFTDDTADALDRALRVDRRCFPGR
jgi:hypothetical protein